MTSPTTNDDRRGGTPPPCLLVVGMHRSGTSATAAALGDLGVALPREDDLLGPSLGNQRGHFESRSLLLFSDELLARLGSSWDDPPVLQPHNLRRAELDPLILKGRKVFEAAFEAPDRPVVWKDPRSTLLLGYWREAIERPIQAVLAVRDPLETARSLDKRDRIGVPTGLALWERYFRHAIAGLAGLPVFVSSFHDALARPTEWRYEIADWLEALGVISPTPPSPGPAGIFDPAMRHEYRDSLSSRNREVLSEQLELFETLIAMRGAHEAFVPPALAPESSWTTALLQQRRDLSRLWTGIEWLGGEIADLVPRRQPRLISTPASLPSPTAYPLDATKDQDRYFHWLSARGDPTSLPAEPGDWSGSRGKNPARTAPPRFSIVVPCFRPPLWVLDRCLSSVLEQSCPSFELLVVDDASGSPELLAHLAEISELDSRLSVIAREENGGIAAATNDALEAASGDYVVFLDHDDELARGALRQLADAIDACPSADVLYSDEDKIDKNLRRVMPSFKPDWSPDLLLSNAYMCHVFVIRRSLVERLGGLRSEFDGAQDYDLMLRATEETVQILHIPEVLYHWRMMEGSASGDPNAKPWA
ncbi:MAG: glycosyltransferase, partial [Acidimicrobiales bacterium]